MKIASRNKKAFFDYEILEKYDAGIVLLGSEVKSVRLGKVNIKDSFVRIIRGEVFLMGMHISYQNFINPHFKPDETRVRKLLLNKKEIDKLIGKVKQDGLSIVALNLYFNKKNLLKVQIALAKGKKLHDKREAIKKRESDRDARAAIKKYV